jgi:Lipocalin-like domain
MFSISTLTRSALSGVALVIFAAGCSSSSKPNVASTTGAVITEAAPAPVESAAPVETTPEAPATSAEPVLTSAAENTPAEDPIALLSGGRQRAWYITQRVTNGGAPDLPVCAKDDELIFDSKGAFISVISGTQCNPNETEVPNGTYKLSTDNQVITFTTPAFSYPGKIITLTDSEMVLEFDLGPGFVIRDSFAKR